jgi:hypothetical protein
VHNPEVQQQLVRLLQLLHVDTSKGSLAGQLQVSTCSRSCRSCVCLHMLLVQRFFDAATSSSAVKHQHTIPEHTSAAALQSSSNSNSCMKSYGTVQAKHHSCRCRLLWRCCGKQLSNYKLSIPNQ